MKQYYLNIDNQQTGPFTIEEIKKIRLKVNDLVWCEGMETWSQASSIEELKEIFTTIPPTLPSKPPKITPITNKIDSQHNKPITNIASAENNKKKIIIIAGVAMLIIVGLILYNKMYNGEEEETYNNENTIAIESITDTTETYEESNSAAIQQQQNQINEQNERIRVQEVAESNRRAQERISELANLINETDTQLSQWEQELVNTSAFKLGRTSEEKQKEMSKIINYLDILKGNKKTYEDEMILINPKWFNDLN